MGSANLRLEGPEPAVSCRRNSVTWMEKSNLKLPGYYISIKSYCLFTEAHEHEQLAQGCYLAAEWPRVE